MNAFTHMSSSLSLLGMPPPYFPAASLAVTLLLAAVAAIPPVLVHIYRRRGSYTARQKLLIIAGGAAWIILTIPDLLRLPSFQGAVACWIQYSVIVFTVSAICTVALAVVSRGKQQTNNSVGQENQLR